MGALRHTHTPTAEACSKACAQLLAASAPCQVNGWASDSSLHIPTVPSHVKPCASATHMVITTPCSHSAEYRECPKLAEKEKHKHMSKY